MSQRNFLRRQIVEYKELNGLKRGCRVSAIVLNQLEQGTVKWIGTIKGILYVGVEFEKPVGNQFPETKGAAPFSCLLSHSRLVPLEDVRTRPTGKMYAAANNGEMDYRHQQPHRLHQPQNDDNNYLVQSVPTPTSCLHLSEMSNDIGTDTDTDNSVVIQHGYGKHENMDISGGDYDDSEFLSTYSSSSMSSTSNVYCDAIYANISDISVQQIKEFDERLSVFYKLGSQTKRLIKEYQMRYEELPVHCRRVEDSSAGLNLNIERLKSFRSDLVENFAIRLQQCKSESEMVSRYSELLIPAEDMKMNREIQEIEQSFSSFDNEICDDIENLKKFEAAHRKLQDLVQERFSRFAVMKTRLVQVERNLVKDESALCLRIKGIQSILSVLERDHNSENSEICKLLDQVRLNDYLDVTRVLSQTNDLMLAEKQLLDEMRAKRAVLLDAKESYNSFISRLATFQSWYNDYMERLSETKVTGPDFDIQHPTLVKEREMKRAEFIEILASAKNLRASIFDYSAVDLKIEALQEQWKTLVEKLYRARSRKTL